MTDSTLITARMGRIPNHYDVLDETADQVRINGPAGRAVITQVTTDGMTTFEIATSFDGQGTLRHYGSRTSEAALARLIELTNKRLTEQGKPIPADISPGAQKTAGFVIIGGLAGVVALIVWGIASLGAGGEDEPNPVPPAPSGPMVQVTIYGPQGKYTGAECEALRFLALQNDNPKAEDALVQYEVHCKTKRLVDSPAPTGAGR